MSTGRRSPFFMFDGPCSLWHRGYDITITQEHVRLRDPKKNVCFNILASRIPAVANLASLTEEDIKAIADTAIEVYEWVPKKKE